MKWHALWLVLAAGTAVAQAPAPQDKDAAAPPNKAPEKKPPLKLKLEADEPARGQPRITFGPKDAANQDPAATLPGMGGGPTRAWERPSDKIFPPDTNPGMR
jgi:hypothetical protein